MPMTAEDYKQRFDRDRMSPLAEAIVAEAKHHNCDTIFSPGCGIARLEYDIKLHSNLKIIVTDYNDSILRLKRFDFFDGCFKLDLFKDDLPAADNCMVLMSRIDTEFNDEQIRHIIKKCHQANIPKIYFIPAQLITWKTPLVEVKIFLKSVINGQKRVFCGYSRSRSHFINLFDKYYSVDQLQKEQGSHILFNRINTEEIA